MISITAPLPPWTDLDQPSEDGRHEALDRRSAAASKVYIPILGSPRTNSEARRSKSPLTDSSSTVNSRSQAKIAPPAPSCVPMEDVGMPTDFSRWLYAGPRSS